MYFSFQLKFKPCQNSMILQTTCVIHEHIICELSTNNNETCNLDELLSLYDDNDDDIAIVLSLCNHRWFSSSHEIVVIILTYRYTWTTTSTIISWQRTHLLYTFTNQNHHHLVVFCCLLTEIQSEGRKRTK